MTLDAILAAITDAEDRLRIAEQSQTELVEKLQRMATAANNELRTASDRAVSITGEVLALRKLRDTLSK